MKRCSLKYDEIRNNPLASLREGGGPHERVVEGACDRAFYILPHELLAESDGVSFPQKITLIY